MVELNEVLENETTAYLEELYKAIGPTCGEASYTMYKAIEDVLKIRKKKPPKPKGIDILMTCGEKHHIDTEQPSIESVKVNGEQIYPRYQPKSDRTMLDMATRKVQLSTDSVVRAMSRDGAPSGSCTIFQVKAGDAGNLNSSYKNSTGVCVYIPKWKIESVIPENRHKDISELNK